MEVVVATGDKRRVKLQSNRHQQQTNIQFFYRPDALTVAQPTVSKHWKEERKYDQYCGLEDMNEKAIHCSRD